MKMKKIVLWVAIFTMLATVPTWGQTYKDVPTGTWYYQDVTDLSAMGIISGTGDGTFKPLDSIRVDAFIKLIVYALGHVEEPGEVYWAQPFIDRALMEGLILPGEFADPTRPITRGEMATIISRALDEPESNVMYEYSLFMKDYNTHREKPVLQAFYHGIITGYPDGNFYPEKLATRAEASAMLIRMIFKNRRIDTDRLGVLEQELKAVQNEFEGLREQYLTVYEAGIDESPYEFENGDLLYESETGPIDAYLWSSGDLFVGPIEQGHFGPLGYFSWIDGSEYMGEIENDNRTGRGITFSKDAVYAGDFFEGALTGQGMFEWQQSYRFIGTFEDGQVNGLTKFIRNDGETMLGIYTDGKLSGEGFRISPDGLVYHGTFVENDEDYDSAVMYRRDEEGLPFEDQIAQIYAEALEPGMSQDEKIMAIHDYLVEHVTYDEEGYESGEIPYISHTAYGALVEGVAVCDGYAGAFNLLLSRLGIESDLVYGLADGENHAWNEVQFEDGKYYVDVTWNDGDNGHIYRDYYKKTLSEMNQDHVIDRVIR